MQARLDSRLPAVLLIATALVWAVPATAQLTFDDFDLFDEGESAAADDDDDFIDIQIGGPVVEQDDDGLSFEGLDLDGGAEAGEAEQRALQAAIRLMEGGQLEAAAAAFHELLGNPAAAVFHHQLEYLLAKTFYELGHYYSSLQLFNRILVLGHAHGYFDVSLEWLFHISREMVNEAAILENIAAYANYEFPERYRSEFRYLLARYHFGRGRALLEAGMREEADVSFDEAASLLREVGEDSEFYPRAIFLDGLYQYLVDRPQAAVERFQDVVRILHPRRGRFRDDRVRDMAFMQLARIHYEHDQPSHAAFYYRRLGRGSEQWLQSLFEASWAYFRMGDFERSLGTMVTLHSPFFEHEYFPESLILKAVIYYENCRYPEAKMIVDEFERLYGPVQVELARITAGRMTPTEYYELLSDVQMDRRPDASRQVLQRILRAALSDREFAAMNDAILEVEAEMAALEGGRSVLVRSGLVGALMDELRELRLELIQKAGMMASAKLYAEMESLKELIGQGLRIRFETTAREREFLEQQLQAGGRLDVVREYAYSVAVSDEELYWPYDGEYWRDELGNYQYTLTRGCRDDRLTASRE
jgi:tetratricopeptide (TPR) repeat protein